MCLETQQSENYKKLELRLEISFPRMLQKAKPQTNTWVLLNDWLQWIPREQVSVLESPCSKESTLKLPFSPPPSSQKYPFPKALPFHSPWFPKISFLPHLFFDLNSVSPDCRQGKRTPWFYWIVGKINFTNIFWSFLPNLSCRVLIEFRLNGI